MKKEKYNIAVIGTGFMARKHCQNLVVLPSASLHTICSTKESEDKAYSFKDEFGFSNTSSDYEATISRKEIDIVYICTPDQFHKDFTILALKANKHVFCEKPLAFTKCDFEEINSFLNSSNGRLQVGMNCRYREQYSIPKEIVRQHTQGELRYIRGTYIYNAVHAVNQRAKPWSLEFPDGINPFLHGGIIHCIDLMQWIGGRIESVFARGTDFELSEQWGVDTFIVSLKFSSGVIGELTSSGSAFKPNDFDLELWFSKGAVVANRSYVRKNDSVHEGEKFLVKQEKLDLQLQYEEFIRSIEEECNPMNSYVQALANFKALDAIQNSIQKGIPIKL